MPFAPIQVVPTTLAWVVVKTLPLKCFEIPVYAFDLHFLVVGEMNLTEWYSGFPYFLQFQSEFGNKEFMI